LTNLLMVKLPILPVRYYYLFFSQLHFP